MIKALYVSETDIMRCFNSAHIEHWNDYSILFHNGLFHYFSRNDKYDFVLLMTATRDLSDEEM